MTNSKRTPHPLFFVPHSDFVILLVFHERATQRATQRATSGQRAGNERATRGQPEAVCERGECGVHARTTMRACSPTFTCARDVAPRHGSVGTTSVPALRLRSARTRRLQGPPGTPWHCEFHGGGRRHRMGEHQSRGVRGVRKKSRRANPPGLLAPPHSPPNVTLAVSRMGF